MKEFDYYIYIDYSENLIGYIIVEENRVKELLKKTTKLRHYKEVKKDKLYFFAIKKRFENEKIINLFLKHKIKECRFNVELFIEIIEFLQKHSENKIFISVDNTFYFLFMKLLRKIYPENNSYILQESKLKKESKEHRLSLLIDNLLVIEKRKMKSN